MSDLFDVHSDVRRSDCDRFATELLKDSVSPVLWQGYYSYTVASQDGNTIIQFRAAQVPLHQNIVELAQRLHPHHVPSMHSLGLLADSNVQIWRMDMVQGVGFAMMVSDVDIRSKLPVTMVDMASFFAADWKSPQSPSEERILAFREECQTKFSQLQASLPKDLQVYVTQCKDSLTDILHRLPWVLTHDDLSSTNIMLDADTGHLRGIIDWADAVISPFGIALWGLESLLGFSNDSGWVWLEDDAHSYRTIFRKALMENIGDSLSSRAHIVENARVLGLLLRYGFVWQDGEIVPTKDASILSACLPRALLDRYGLDAQD